MFKSRFLPHVSLCFCRSRVRVCSQTFNEPEPKKVVLHQKDDCELTEAIHNMTHLQPRSLFMTNSKQGPLSAEIGKLTLLSWLEITSGNAGKLTSLPTQIGLLGRLVNLSLQSNQIHSLPTQLGQLADLTLLNLANNNIEVLPPDFGRLERLQVADLKRNALSVLPAQMGRLLRLTSLNLASNQLTSLVSQVGLLKSLSYLNLQSNKLQSLPRQIANLSALDELVLISNDQLVLPFPPTQLDVDTACSHMELTWVPSIVPPRIASFKHYHIQVDFIQPGAKNADFQAGNTSHFVMSLIEVFKNGGTSAKSFRVRMRAVLAPSSKSITTGDALYSEWSNAQVKHVCAAFMRRNKAKRCQAISGFYQQKNGLARSCAELARELPSGALKDEMCVDKIGTKVDTLPVSDGFWRPSMDSEDIRLCPREEFCTKHGASSENLPPETSPHQYCAQYHKGIYCTDCVKGYALGSKKCELCTTAATESMQGLATLAAILIGLLLCLYVYVLWQSKFFKELCCSGRRRRVVRSKSSTSKVRERVVATKRAIQYCHSFGSIAVMTKVRILLGYLQVLLSYQRTFQRQSLGNSNDLLGFIAIWSNLDFTWLLGSLAFRCVYNYDHYDILLLATLGPIIVMALLFAGVIQTAQMVLPFLKRRVIRHAFSAMLLVLFMVYPYVSQTILSTFWCEDFPDANKTFNLTTSALRADYRLSCEIKLDPRRAHFEVYAGLMILVYPIGVVVLYGLVLHINKWRIMSFDREKDTEKLVMVSFLIKPYKTQRYWFEAYELVRKLFQTSFVGFLANVELDTDYPEITALIAQNMTIIFCTVLAMAQPYKHLSDFVFAMISLLLLIPAAQYSILDPYSRDEGIVQYGLSVLVLIEFVFFFLFVLLEFVPVILRNQQKHTSRDPCCVCLKPLIQSFWGDTDNLGLSCTNCFDGSSSNTIVKLEEKLVKLQCALEETYETIERMKREKAKARRNLARSEQREIRLIQGVQDALRMSGVSTAKTREAVTQDDLLAQLQKRIVSLKDSRDYYREGKKRADRSLSKVNNDLDGFCNAMKLAQKLGSKETNTRSSRVRLA